MKRLRGIACIAAAAALIFQMLPGTASALPGQSSAYTVRHDSGGRIIDYAIKMKRIEQARRAVRFDGRCDSACTLFLALPASKACVTPRARFGFHLPYGSSTKGNQMAAKFMLSSYPRWVRSWLNANGGLTNKVKVMPFEYARRHLGECSGGSNRMAVES